MNEINWNAVNELLSDLTVSDVVPGCALSVRFKGIEVYNQAYGTAEIRPNKRMATTDTIWDLASITKVLCTAHLFLIWTNNGQIDVQDEISTLLPHAAKGVTIQDLLSHSSGYPAWAPLYSKYKQESTWGTPAIRSDLLKRAATPSILQFLNNSYTYSDLGFLTLCAYAEAKFGKPIHILWNEYLPERAKEGLYWGHPMAAATEDCPTRNRVVVGEVHDLNAAVLGGKSTHAGLFGTASTLSRVAEWSVDAYHGRIDEIEAELIRYFWSYRGLGSHCLGWDTPSGEGSSASAFWPKNGVGHLGFTGTSLWIAPDEELIVAFTSNRVHPHIEGGALPNAITGPKTKAYRAFRPKLHQTILETLGLIATQGLTAG